MQINLRGYQKEAIDNIFGIDGKPGLYDDYGFAAVFLPTGGGKSFVGMEAMNRIIGEYNDSDEVISEKPMLYLTPNLPIISQYQTHVAEHMIFEHHINYIESREGKISKEQIFDTVKVILKKFNEKANIDENALKKFIEKNNDIEDPEMLLRMALKNQLVKQSEKVISDGVQKAFPKLQFKCYQAMRSRKIKEDSSEKNYDEQKYGKKFFVEDIESDFVIVDEAHRGAAQKWKEYLGRLVDTHKNAKYLAITATPDRDSDDYSIINLIAEKTGYSVREVRNRKYVAKYLDLIEAMKQKLVVTPKIIHTNCTLDETKAYREVKEKVEDLRQKKNVNGNILRMYEVILTRMNYLMGRTPNMSDEDWAIRKKELLMESIGKSGINPNTKCIAFIPKSKSEDTSKEHVLEYAEKVKELLSGGLDVNNESVSVRPYHSAFSDSENTSVLEEFRGAETDSGGMKVLVTNSKLDEGVHVDNVGAEIMLDEITAENANKIKETPKIKFTQKIGRTIFSIDPNHPELAKQPIIFDLAHNFLWQHHLLKDKEGKPFFDITPEEAEFIELYDIFRHNPSKIIYKGNSIEEAILTGKMIFVYNKLDENGNKMRREFPSGQTELTPSLIRKVNNEKGKRYNSKGLPLTEIAGLRYKDRFEKMVDVLKELKNSGINVQNIDEDIPFSEEFLEANGLVGEEKEVLLDNLFKTSAKGISENIQFSVYPLGEEMKNFRGAFFGVKGMSNSETKKIFEKANFEELAKLGIFSVDLTNIPEELKDNIDKNGFIKPHEKVPEKFWGLNIKSGTKYLNGRDEFGLDKNGYDVYGYDKDGFNKDGIHRITGQKYDERFFYKSVEKDPKTNKEIIVWKNLISRNETDRLGYNHDGINPETGFDRGTIDEKGKLVRLWHEKIKDGFSRLTRTKNKNGIDQHGFKGKRFFKNNKDYGEMDDWGFFSNGMHKSHSYTDYEGYDIDGFNTRGFARNDFHRETSSEYGLDGRNRKGELHPDVKLMNEIIAKLKYKMMTPDEICQKFNISREEVDTALDSAMTMMALAPELKTELNNDLTKRTDILDVLGELSPKMANQMKERIKYKNAVLKELTSRYKDYIEQGKEEEIEFKNLTERIARIKSSIIVRDDDAYDR